MCECCAHIHVYLCGDVIITGKVCMGYIHAWVEFPHQLHCTTRQSVLLLYYSHSPVVLNQQAACHKQSHMTNTSCDKHATSKSHGTWKLHEFGKPQKHPIHFTLHGHTTINSAILIVKMLRHTIILLPNLVTLISVNIVRIADEQILHFVLCQPASQGLPFVSSCEPEGF